MTRNIKKIGILTIIVMLFLGIVNLTSVKAATTTLTASSATVKSGETFSVTVKSSIKLTGWTISLSDNGGCTFSTASGGELTGTTIFGTALNGETSLAKYTFKAPTVTKETKYTIKFSGTAMCDIDTNEVSNTTCTTTITVQPTTTSSSSNSSSSNNSGSSNSDTTTTVKTKSNNAYLSTLGVTPKEYDFSGFKKTTMNYSVTVPSDVDSLKVLYKTADSNAKVKVTGNSGFEVGSDNKITIKVTAEDGKTTKTYTIKVTKLAEEEEKPGNVIEDEEEVYLTSLELEGIDLSPKFAKDTYSYTAELDDANATEIKVNATANKKSANVEISGNTDLVDGENTINIIVTLEGSEEQAVYQVVLTKAEKEVVVTNTENTSSENGGSLNDLMGNLKKYIIIAVAVVVFIILAVIVLIILLRRENKKMKEEELSEDNQNEEYNVYKNDVNEFENKSSEADNFIETLYRQRNGNLLNEDELSENEKQTLEEINRETDKIFSDKVTGQSVEYDIDEVKEEKRPRRREKGKHSK